MGGSVGLGVTEVEIFFFGHEVHRVFEDKPSKLVVAKFVQKQLLISLVSLVVEDQYPSERV